MCLGVFLHLKPTTECRISTLIFDLFLEGGLYEYPMNNILRTAKFLPTWGFNQRYWWAFNWLKCLGVLLHLKPTVGCQISNLIFAFSLSEKHLYKYPIKNILRTAKFLPTWEFNQRYCLGLYQTEVSGWVSAPQAHSRVSTINFHIWIFFCGGASI